MTNAALELAQFFTDVKKETATTLGNKFLDLAKNRAVSSSDLYIEVAKNLAGVKLMIDELSLHGINVKRFIDTYPEWATAAFGGVHGWNQSANVRSENLVSKHSVYLLEQLGERYSEAFPTFDFSEDPKIQQILKDLGELAGYITASSLQENSKRMVLSRISYGVTLAQSKQSDPKDLALVLCEAIGLLLLFAEVTVDEKLKAGLKDRASRLTARIAGVMLVDTPVGFLAGGVLNNIVQAIGQN